MTDPAPIRLDRDGRVATLTVDRPPLNILDLATLAELGDRVGELAGDDELAVVVVRGAGARAFSAGVSVDDHTPDKVADMLRLFHGALGGLRGLPAVTVAAVAGHCLGGGMELAAACDLVVAEESARFGQPEIELGCFPPWAAADYPARLGPARTLELLATGRLFDGAEAERLGFVTRLTASGELDVGLAELIGSLTAKSTAVLRLTKRAVEAGRDRPFADALAESERLYLDELCRTADMDEGLAAFVDKRRPVWQHR